MLPLDASSASVHPTTQSHDSSSFSSSFHNARESFERSYLLHYLDQNDWNISRTATSIGMERSQLHRKIKSFGLSTPEKKE
jgi:two-component system nitrogen regulation response regulator NtrX